jgi:predicted RNase H-like HicB family nuclease
MRFHVNVYEDGGQWTAEVVDAPGVATCAPTREDALIAAVDALSGWVESYAPAGPPFLPKKVDVLPEDIAHFGKKPLRVILLCPLRRTPTWVAPQGRTPRTRASPAGRG